MLALLLLALAAAPDVLADGAREPEALALLEEGSELFLDRRYTDAEAKLRRAIGTGSLPRKKLALAWTYLGLTHEKRDDFGQAIAAHAKAIEVDPSFEVAWVNKGIAHRKEGELAEAESCYRKAITINPRYAEAWSSLGALHIFRRQAAEAIEALERAVALDATIPASHANLAIAFALNGRFEEADAALARAIDLGYRNHGNVRRRIEEERETWQSVHGLGGAR